MYSNIENIEERRRQALLAVTPESKQVIWSSALEADGYSCEETLIRENMDYLHATRSEVLLGWGRKGTRAVKERWVEQNPQTDEQIVAYYNFLDLYITELSSWHSDVNIPTFLRTVEFLQLCIKNELSSYLDFGSGIGSSAILFSKHGFTPTLADISDVMLKYAQWRLARHGVDAKFLDLKSDDLVPKSVDCATAIEVLEHIPDPNSAMSKIHKALKPGGYAFVSTPFYSDPERPQHLIHNMEVAESFESLGFTLLSVTDNGLFRTYRKDE